ncbi:non-ribosomal peptide synthetase [Paenibacillus sp. P46E]|uniref:non-ribosomal peptide synthetase n=1 Tax=Paenibacillus sp. P46E TaxID=1349436 RepID=UPI00093D6F7D|nr:non-ribosomal peptide synthetase [Paenibacillus sp. P46E]OKP97904.1 hypothetical protein A3849_13410 [Paenibacillus sp. P46E]
MSDPLKKGNLYWSRKLSGELTKSSFPADFAKRDESEVRREQVEFTVAKELSEQINKLGNGSDEQIHTILSTALILLLNKYTGNNDIIIGTPLLTKALVLRNHIHEQSTIDELLLGAGQTLNEALEHPYFFIDERLSQGKKDSGEGELLYAIMIMLEEFQGQASATDSDVDMLFSFAKKDQTLQGTIHYNANLYKQDTVCRISNHFLNALQAVLCSSKLAVKNIEILSEKDKRQLLYEFNDNAKEYPKEATIQELFEQQAEKTPIHTAVVHGERKLTYQALNQKANSLARALRTMGVKRESIVGIMAEKSLSTIIGIMGILKAGGTFLPIDPSYPVDRIQYMLEDSGARMLLTTNENGIELDYDGDIVDLDGDYLYNNEQTNLGNISVVTDIAYVIYTSGTTGRPKGVMVNHSGIGNLKAVFVNDLGICGDDKIIQFASFSFDASVWEMSMALLNGAELHILSNETIGSYVEFTDYINRNHITVMTLPPAYLNHLDSNEVETVRLLVTAGSSISRVLLEKWVPKVKYINAYGPTESTICSTMWTYGAPMEKKAIELPFVPIGKPIANLQAYIVNDYDKLVPIGVAGELCVSGISLARGYLNKEELTHEKFVDHIFEPGAKMYRTGDLARWLPDGNIEFIGRMDNQVKIRGYRIETAEIEHQLLKQQAIQEAVVVDRIDQREEKYLCAYVTADTELEVSQVRDDLAKVLPSYMLPGYIIQIEQLPLTPNGKIDRKQLPEPDLNRMRGAYEAPRSEVEEQLAAIWGNVLGMEGISIHDDFFDLGGHSLTAALTVSQVRKVLGVDIKVRELFEHSTIQRLGSLISSLERQEYASITQAASQPYYTASSAEKRMYALWEMDKQSVVYNLPVVLEFQEALEDARVEAVLNEIVQRHEALRTHFEVVNGEVVQYIHESWKLDFTGEAVHEGEVEEAIRTFVTPFDLNEAPLLRSRLLRCGAAKSILLLDVHHIVMDGISSGVFVREFQALYEGAVLEAPVLQYKDYSEWQNSRNGQEVMNREKDYWLERLSGELPLLNLHTDEERPRVKQFEGDRVHFEAGAELTAALQRVARETGTTIYMVLLAVYNVMLWKYTGQEDIIVGTVESGRSHSELQETMGMFVNTVALRNYPAGSRTFREFLEEVKRHTLADFEHAAYPYENLLNLLNLQKDSSRNLLFDVMFAFESMDYGFAQEKRTGGIKIIEPELQLAMFDLTLTAKEANDNLDFSLEYCSRLFNKAAVMRMGEHYTRLLSEVAATPDKELGGLDMVTDQEKQILLNVFNTAPTAYPKDKTIQELFEEQADRTPDQLAVVCGDQALTYKELNEQANSLASVLRAYVVKKETIIGIMAKHSLNMVVGVLGILKAGAVYLPIDLEYPEERISYMLKDSQAVLLLSHTENMKNLNDEVPVIDLDNNTLYSHVTSNPKTGNDANHLAYVIYTSGTTGNPKGVMVEHKALINLCLWHNHFYSVSEEDRATKYAGFGFDASVWEIFPYLVAGASIHIVDRSIMLDINELNRFYEEQGITISFLPTQICEQFMELENKSLRKLLTGADKLKKYRKQTYELINNYGPTENTVVTTSFVVDKNYKNIPIGKPIANTDIYILDQHNQLVPVGVPGELNISGASLARGYLYRDDLTHEKFVENPFHPGAIMYKTGDLAKWLPDGNIQYLGRIDNQVKIRGYRVETAEIENQLLKLKAVQETVVVARIDDYGNSFLCGYIVADPEISAAAIKAELSKVLPLYMIPGYFIHVDKMPLTPNGKIDKKALAGMKLAESSDEMWEAPRNSIEEILVSVWEDTLRVERIGINDNYYELGGDSIKSIMLVSRLQKHNLRLEVRDIMQYPTIKELSPHIKKHTVEMDQGDVEGDVEFAPIQRWFLERRFPEENHFNQAFMFTVEEGIDELLLRSTFEIVINHHDALRMIYLRDQSGKRQVNRGAHQSRDVFKLDIYDLSEDLDYKSTIESLADQIQQGMDLEKGILIRLGLFRTRVGDQLLISIHHMVMDGVSWRILLEDLEYAYRCVRKGNDVILPDKTASYREWTHSLAGLADSREMRRELPYWKKVENTQVAEIPRDFEVQESTFGKSNDITVCLSKKWTERLLRKTNAAYNTQINDLLLCSLGMAVKEWTGSSKILVSLEGHGREDLVKDLSIDRTIGWFTSMYPVILDMSHSDDMSACIKYTKETLRGIPNKGIGYGILKYLASSEGKGDVQFKLNPDISFNYLGEFTNPAGQVLLRHSELSCGRGVSLSNPKLNAIEINGLIIDGQLKLVFNYSTEEFRHETIERLTEGYLNNLTAVIEHCEARKKTEKTPSDYGDKELTLEDLAVILSSGEPVEKIHSLTPMQEGMLYHLLLDHRSQAYFEQLMFTLEGKLNLSHLNTTLNKLIEKYEILRTAFFYEELSTFKQAVMKERTISVNYEDISHLDDNAKETFIEHYKDEDRARGFDLTKDCLIRVSVMKISRRRYQLLYSFHHIIMDGWCTGLLMKDAAEIYTALCKGQQLILDSTEPYSKYLKWLDQQDQDAAIRYWSQYLDGYEQEAGIPRFHTDRESVYQRRKATLQLSKEVTTRLKHAAEKNRLTLNALVQTAWGVLLQKYNHSEDVVFGSIISGRQCEVADIDKMVGLFINAVPVRVKGDKSVSFLALAQQINNDFYEANTSYGYSSLADLQALTSMKGNLINHMVVYENYPLDKPAGAEDGSKAVLNITGIEAFEQTHYDFGIVVLPGEELTFEFTYNGYVYNEEIIGLISSNLGNILDLAASDLTVKIGDISGITEQERNRILSRFNNTNSEYLVDKSLQQLFQEQAEKSPDQVAVVFQDKQLTYKELNEKANRLARALLERGVGRNSIAALLLEPSENLLVGMLGVLKAGSAFLPMDEEAPGSRIGNILNDSQAKVLISTSRLIETLEGEIDIECLDIGDEALYEGQESSNVRTAYDLGDGVYVIYTSGTTGNPKGVSIRNQSLANYVRWAGQELNLNSSSRSLVTSKYSFDLCYTSIFPVLACGGELHVIPKESYLNPPELLEYVQQNQISYLKMTPTLFSTLMDYDSLWRSCADMKTIILGGERLSIQNVMKLAKECPWMKFMNHYGPTESTIGCIAHYMDLDNVHEGALYRQIGRPITNTKVYIVDPANQIVPIGATGEICISGMGLAKGYLYNETLTEEKFVNNPFLQGAKMYKTGDLGRWRPDGSIEYFGRLDNQIKIRGFRIEIGEIEQQLLKQQVIKEAVVVDRIDQREEKYLCAYVTADTELEVSQVRDDLAKVLPSYMLPGYIIQIEQLPLTPNGKIDRKQLPEPDLNRMRGAYEAPRSEVEEQLAAIWGNVLGMEGISIHDDFFDLGGHSLTAALTVSQVRKVLGVDIKVRELFEHSTIQRLGSLISSLERQEYASITQAASQPYYTASSAEKRMYALWEMDKQSIVYNVPVVLEFQEALEDARVEAVLNEIVQRHEALRTHFEVVNGEVVQYIHESWKLDFTGEALHEGEVEEAIRTFVTPFDLSEAPLLRSRLLRCGAAKSILLLDVHHIVMDGISIGVFIREFQALYEGAVLEAPVLQYKDYSEWQNSRNGQEVMNREEDYWLERLSGELPLLNLHTDEERPRVKQFEGDRIHFEAGAELTAALQRVARETGTTIYMVLLAIYNVMLWKYTGQEDIIVGTVESGRSHSELQETMGMFVNTVALRNYPAGSRTFREFLEEVKRHTLADFEHTHYQFEKVIQKLNLKSDTSRNPLFDVMFVLENLDYGLKTNVEQAKIKLIEPMADIAKFDLTLTAKEANDNLDFSLEYCSRLFSKATVMRMGEHYTRLLAEVAATPDKELGGLDMITDQEKQMLLNVFNTAPTAYPKDKTIQELFEEQVDRTPDLLAVVCGDQALTYKELNEQANSLASVLREKGVAAETVIGIMADRSLELIIGILGILKSGGAYLPIDPEYPADRINYMLTDSQAAMLLLQHHIVKDLTYTGERLDLENRSLYVRKTGNPVKVSMPGDLAYVIYTSGTTGNPKGVMVEHKNLVNYIYWANKRYVAGDQAAFPLYSSISFDLTVTSIYTPLISGNTIVIYAGEDKALLTRTIAEENKVHILKLTPTHLRLLEDMDLSRSSIRKLIVGGEDLKTKVAEKIHRAFDGRIEIYNEYGPTEATVGCMIYKYNVERDKGTSVSIGIAADNTQLYILGSRMELLPIGVAGELCIGGDGVARGYLYKEALTAEKFVDHPYKAGGKLYKTGDMARWLPDGTVEYLGRMDNQVKVRGYRIETGEIENRLLQMPDITEAVVVARTDDQGHNYLCAYVVSNKEVTASEIRGGLSKELPSYMVPSYAVQIAKLPLSSNGKVDIKALPVIDINEMQAATYEAPINEIEGILVDVWQKVLHIEPIGTNYNYYEMGGDSIKSILIVSALREHRLRLEVKDLMQYPSIKELADYVKYEDVQVPQGAVEGSVQFLPVQQWFFEKGLTQENHYNQAFMFYRKEGLDEEILRKAFVAIIVHHDALRMVYKRTHEGITQWNRSTDFAGDAFTLDVYDLRDEDEESSIPELSGELQKGLDLEKGLLLKVGLFKTRQGDHLLVAVHHLVMDGVSWRILIADLESAYRSISSGTAVSLPPKTTSYRSWAQKLKEYASGRELLHEAEYWKTITNINSVQLPKDFGEEHSGYCERMEVSLNFSKEQTARLLRNTNTAYNTQINDVLLCSLGLAFKEWGGMEKLLVSLEGHGREDIFQGVSIDRTVGWFTTIYPIVVDMTHSHDIAYSLKHTKEMLRHVPGKGIGYGVWKYLSNGNKEMRTIEPEVCFNYLGEFGKEAENSLLKFSKLSSGASISSENKKLNGIDINGLIMEGQLELVFSYSTLEYQRETVEQLTTAFHTSLLRVIDHCAHQHTAEKTPWDYGDPDLSLEDLHTLLACGKEIEKIHSLSPMQEGMMYNTIVDAGSSTYFEQSELNIEGNLNVDILNVVLNQVIEKYEILRTAFFYHDIKRFKQTVLKERKLHIRYEDVSSSSIQEKSGYVEQFKMQDRSNPFDLGQDCLIRVAVIKTDAGKFKVVYSFHHIIMDGWSAGIIIQEVITQYKALVHEEKLEIVKAVPYSHYLNWLDHQDKTSALDYWQAYLEAYELGTMIPELQHKEKGFKHQQERILLEEQITAKLKCLAETNSITLSSVIQTAWGVVLQKYSNTNDVVFGSVVSGRPSGIRGIENMVGLCINTVPVRVTGEEHVSFIDLAKKLNKDFVQANTFSYCQLAEIQALTPMKNSLINHVVVYENYPVDQSLVELQGPQGAEVKITAAQGFEQTNYDLEILIAPGHMLQIKMTYNGHTYSRDVISALMDNLVHVLNCAVSNPDESVENMDMVSERERNKLLHELNCTGTAYAKDKTIAQLFEEQAERTPEAIALEFHGAVLSYRELNKRANQLAGVLRKNGVRDNVIVPILVKRSLNLLVGILGVLKAGGGYLPLDTDYPVDRINYMLQDSQANLLLTEKGLASSLDLSEAVKILDIGSKQIQDEDESNLQIINKAEDLAYVLYTSGSTGKPKGVAIEHRAVHNFITGITDRISFTPDKIILSVTTCSFDIFGLETLLPLTRGLKVVIASEEEQKDPYLLNKVIVDSEVNTIQLTPSRLKLMLNCSNTPESFKKLKLMMIGGEGFPKDLLAQLKQFTDSRIYNMYGPTETTIWSAVKELTHENNVNVGKPIANTQVYIVDQIGHIAPMGVAGELCIAGDGIARGYLHKEELTASKFVDNPFIEGTKMYKTGDLARWLPNGELDVIGRLDNQVKIGGYRIELGEIESVAARYDKIKQCVVAGQPNVLGSQDLVLYFVAAEKINISELVNFLSPVLPKYMMPQMYIQIDEVPLTANGKTNLKALPKPGNARPDLRDDYEEAVTDLQKEIQHIWSMILNIEKVGIYDNFFEVGGNSLKIVAMYNELQKLYPDKIQITDIFSYPTISKLAQFIDTQFAFAEAAATLDHEGMAIELPAAFLAAEAEPNDGRVLRFSFAGDSYAGMVHICSHNQYDIIHLLLAGYVFLLSDICQRERFTLQFSDQRDGRFSLLEMDIAGLDDFHEIVSLVKDKLKHVPESAHTVQSDLEVFRTGMGSTVLPLFSRVDVSNLLTDHADTNDVVLEAVEKTSEIGIELRYNRSKLKQSKMHELFNQYIKLLQVIIESDERTSTEMEV